MPLWDGRFSDKPDKLVAQFTESISYDRRLYPYDILGSTAHAKMLAKQGIIPQEDADAIVNGLAQIQQEIESGNFQFRQELEDIHMNIEARLTELIGKPGERLHTGRSRNDQIATDERLFLRFESIRVADAIRSLQKALLAVAEQWPELVMPGFTHMQHAQPVLFAHHLLAYIEMFGRDTERLRDFRKRVNRLPLGAGAIAGSTLPLDREFVARELGFESVLRNSMDAVADRDYIVEFLGCLSIIAMHLSRLAEDIVIWFSQEFAFIELGDAFTTGSSLMPQKKNPDVAELTRGKTGRIYGHLMAILTTLKGLPLTYNRDLQEDKEGLFDALDSIKLSLATMSAMLGSLKPRPQRMEAAANDPSLCATDLAEWLVKHGTPFREAHHQVGRFVALCLDNNIPLNQASFEQMKACLPYATPECLSLFDAHHSTAARTTYGGTAPERVTEQLALWHSRLFPQQDA